MTSNEMELHASLAECGVPPTIDGVFAFEAALTISSELIENMVARDGVEPPTPAFSVLRYAVF
jgi:hypothetical protein